MVLLGQGLGGRHQGGLGAVLHSAQHRVEGHHGLARAHLPHEQPLHRALASQVGVDLGHRAHLVAGQLEGKRPAPAVHHHATGGERACTAALAARAAAADERELQQQELLERQPAPCAGLVLLAIREVRAGERGGALGQASATRIAAGSGSGVCRNRPRASHTSERRRAAGRPSVAGWTGTSPTVCTGAPVAPMSSCSVTAELPAAPDLPVEEHVRPLWELARKPGLVPPDRDQRARLRRRRAPRRACGGGRAWV